MLDLPFSDGDRVVVIGERLGESDQSNQAIENSAWLRRMRDMLIALKPERNIEIIDRSAEAQTLHQVRQRWDDDVCGFKPNGVIVNLGLSDTWQSIRKDPDFMEPADFKTALSELLAHHHSQLPESRILLMGQPFLNPDHDPCWNTGQVWSLLPGYHQAMREAAAEQQHIYIDVQADIDEALTHEGANFFGPDDQHPNQEGSLLIAHAVLKALGAYLPGTPKGLKAGDNVVFIGDSITDAGRRQHALKPFGTGYMRLWHALLSARDPALARSLNITNRGIGGNTIRNLKYRWQTDCLDHQPDHLVVKIGINDINRYLSKGGDPVSPTDYEDIYDDLLARVRAQNPQCSITLLSAYFLSRDTNPLSYRHRVLEILPEYSAALKRIGVKYDAAVVDLHDIFQQHLKHRSHVTFGGNNGMDIVHPSETGCMVIAENLYSAIAPM